MTLALIVMVLNLLVMLVPAEVRGRLKESWDVFWPPWQDRASLPGGTSAKDAEGFSGGSGDLQRAKESRSSDSGGKDEKSGSSDLSEEDRARLKERQRAKMMAEAKQEEEAKLAESKKVERTEKGRPVEKERERSANERSSRSRRSDEEAREKATADSTEETLSAQEKEKLQARQKARLESAEAAKAAGESLTEEEKAKIRARQKARAAAAAEGGPAEDEEYDKRTKELNDKDRLKLKAKERAKMADPTERDEGDRKGSALPSEETSKMERGGVRVEGTDAISVHSKDSSAGVEAKASHKARSESASRRAHAGSELESKIAGKEDLGRKPLATRAQATPPEGLSRSELARWYKTHEEGSSISGDTAKGSVGIWQSAHACADGQPCRRKPLQGGSNTRH